MKSIKKSIITKSIQSYKINRKIKRTYLPKAGDVAIFQVISIGKHKAVQGVNGNNSYIFPGDKIMAVFGTRYATGQFEGYVPKQYHSKYQILGQGGVVGVLASMHSKFKDVGATEVRLIGYAVDESNRVLNTYYKATNKIKFNPKKKQDYKIYLSLGASMDSGKTTSAAFLSRGFMMQKKKVAFIKLTGTVYAKDCSLVRDCGAQTAVDFSYCGYPSTYLCKRSELLAIFETLLNRVERIKPEVVIIEIADGLLQKETKMLINHKPFMNRVDGVMLSCADSLSVSKGVELLTKLGHKPFIISGMFTASPLLTNEARAITKIPVFTLEDFTTKEVFAEVFPTRIKRRKKKAINGSKVISTKKQ